METHYDLRLGQGKEGVAMMTRPRATKLAKRMNQTSKKLLTAKRQRNKGVGISELLAACATIVCKLDRHEKDVPNTPAWRRDGNPMSITLGEARALRNALHAANCKAT